MHCGWLSLTVGACKVKCNSECTKQRVWAAGKGNKNKRKCSFHGQLEALMQVTDTLGVRFCVAPGAEFTSCPFMKEQTDTHFWGAAAMLSVRNSLRLCIVTLDYVLSLFSLSLTLCVLFPTGQLFWQLISLSSCTPSCTRWARHVRLSTCGSRASEWLVSSQTNAGALVSYQVGCGSCCGYRDLHNQNHRSFFFYWDLLSPVILAGGAVLFPSVVEADSS